MGDTTQVMALQTALTGEARLVVDPLLDADQARRAGRLASNPATLVSLCLATCSAFKLPIGELLADRLVRLSLIEPEAKYALILAVTEAVANAAIHGNLALASPDRIDHAAHEVFWHRLDDALADPSRGNLPILVVLRRHAATLHLHMIDQGRGYPFDKPATPRARPGRGLQLMAAAGRMRRWAGGRAVTIRLTR